MVQLAVDLHLHSRHARAVSSAMTIGNIAHWAQRKGLDLLGTGDCLQAEWLAEVEASMDDAEPGLFRLKPGIAEKVAAGLPARLRRELRFVLSTEVSCAPPGTPELGGTHWLIYFPSIEGVRKFRERIAGRGDLREGRPTLNLTPCELLQIVAAQGDDCHMAPAHIFSPWYSALGSVSGGQSLHEACGEFASRLFAVETGMTSIPPMCRRVSGLDAYALYSCSDAHSPRNLGRECTIMEIEPSYAALFAALKNGPRDAVLRTIKFPVEQTRYYLNRCGRCVESFEGKVCPRCGQTLAVGARDRLEMIADRAEPRSLSEAPPFQQLLPLAYVIGGVMGADRKSVAVERHTDRLADVLGSERFILTEARFEEIADVATPQLARLIVRQRAVVPDAPAKKKTKRAADEDQLSFGLPAEG